MNNCGHVHRKLPNSSSANQAGRQTKRNKNIQVALTSSSFRSLHSAIHHGPRGPAGLSHRSQRSWAGCCCHRLHGRRWPGLEFARFSPAPLPWSWTGAAYGSPLAKIMRGEEWTAFILRFSNIAEWCIKWCTAIIITIYSFSLTEQCTTLFVFKTAHVLNLKWLIFLWSLSYIYFYI